MNSVLHAAPANSLVDALTNYSGALTQLTAALQGKKIEEKTKHEDRLDPFIEHLTKDCLCR